MHEKLFPCVVCLNHRYFPESANAANVVGATSFALNVIECLEKQKLLSGIILYKRDESIKVPILDEHQTKGHLIFTLRFNFNMKPICIKKSIEEALLKMKLKQQIPYYPIVYYQTDTLMKYHPDYIPSVVTHHGPFVDDFIKHYSFSEACVAYETVEKTKHLIKYQKEGLSSLIKLKNAYVLQHSELQRKYLIASGFNEKKILKITPPIQTPCTNQSHIRKAILDFTNPNADNLIFISTVARIDHFKNIDLFVKSSLILLEQNLPVKIFIAGDRLHFDSNREALYQLIPRKHEEKFFICESLSKNELYSLFCLLKQRAVFVCTSRYETLGITPLEASLSGVYTVAPDIESVEASRYMPENCKYSYTVSGLAKHLQHIYSSEIYRSKYQYYFVNNRLSYNKFEKSLLCGLEKISNELHSLLISH
ncbi:Glycosyltransferase involved in cell wall bisynthesis [Evansella caseinilytica]|uniref:Glycosyltransferase involved in cell wall bisynthesis n=1 Tax=Evansella caseinilytica TaxID=1503961 RepID=A0A1H3U176_9BACI|nr:glycosyltransferase [Evansella caseinilytica]SDZ56264.1 Glycosyltransferase involved in cell wall bisynthesis [Evansella caseinilytica]